MVQEYNFLIALLRAFLTGVKPEIPGEMDHQLLSKLAQIHNVSGILGYMDMLYGIYPEETQRRVMRQTCLTTMGLYAQRSELARKRLEELDKQGIPYCTMKGLELRELYPVPELRTFSDVDILIRPEDRQRCHALLLEAGFMVKTDWEPVYTYFLDQEHYEFHTQLMEIDLSDKADYRAYFDQAWEHAERVTEFGHRLKPEFHLIYLLTHIAKHVQGSGAGVRMYMDIAVYLRHYARSLDWDYVARELDILALTDFARTVFTVVESWFGVPMPSGWIPVDQDLVERFTEYTMEAGIFGKHGRETGTSTLKHQENGSRMSALLRRAFPSAQSIERRYTYLQGRHWLLPFAWVHRLFKTDVSLKDHAMEAKTILSADAGEIDRLKHICRDVGL